MKKIFLSLLAYFSIFPIFAQLNEDQNLLKTSTTNVIGTNSPAPLRFEVASVSYNSYHWQTGGIIIVELFQKFFGTDYQKYTIENGFEQGVNSGIPKVTLLECKGLYHYARVSLGNPVNLGTEYGGYANYSRAIYVDCRDYSRYVVKITYLQDRVDSFTGLNQIKINLSPNGIATDSFSGPSVADQDFTTSGTLKIVSTGDSYLLGNLGIGTATPREKLSVNGNIRAKEVKVETANWPDYVFKTDYKIVPLTDLETYIKTNRHLPEMPTAKEAETNGIELGEMNKRLLQKIEELTLYLIELKKENEQLKTRVEAIELSKK